MDLHARIIHEIDSSPLNRGLRGIDWVSDPRNVAITEGDDLALFDYVQPGVYEGPFFFQSRGKAAVEAAKIITARMLETAPLIIGRVPLINRKAAVIARSAGYRCTGIEQTEHGPVFVYGKMQ